jgi:hypothetical protein
MIKATLTKTTSGTYVIETESGLVTDLGRRHPSAKRQRAACKPALNEEVIVHYRTDDTEYHLSGAGGPDMDY